MTSLTFRTETSTSPLPADERLQALVEPGFGNTFTDHMVSVRWTLQRGWHDASVRPYAPLVMDPATAVLHYAQAIFEGFKAYRHADGSIWTFRPEANARRFARSAHRLALPELPTDDFIAGCDALIRADAAWVPEGGEKSLYLRPFMFASEVFLGVRPADEVLFLVIASPAGSYFAAGFGRCRSGYRSTTRGQRPGHGCGQGRGKLCREPGGAAGGHRAGCDQVAFLDAVERRWVEELAG